MPDDIDVEELNLSDSQLMKLFRNHGLDRRSMMKLLGVGAGVTALSGSAAAKSRGRGNRIDEIYGAPYEADRDTVPSGLVDHTINLHVHPPDPEAEHPNGAHPGFPPDENEDGIDDGPETFFDPVGLHVKPGEIVEFTSHGVGLHTVTSFHPKFNEPPILFLPKRVPTNYGFSSPPVSSGDSWLYKFTEKGVYDIFCLPHVSFGMVVRIVVFDPEDDDIDDELFDEYDPDSEAPLPPAAAMVLNNPPMDPEDIVEDGPVAWEDLTLPLAL